MFADYRHLLWHSVSILATSISTESTGQIVTDGDRDVYNQSRTNDQKDEKKFLLLIALSSMMYNKAMLLRDYSNRSYKC